MNVRPMATKGQGIQGLRLASWPPGIWMIVAVLGLVGLTGPNWDLALLALGVLLLGMRLLWRPGEPPILLFVFGYQWLQAGIAIFHANVLGQHIDEFSLFGADMWHASLLSLLACLVGALGLKAGVGRMRVGSTQVWAAWTRCVPVRRWFRLYLMAMGVAFLLQSVAWVIPGLRQIFLALAGLKWAFFWMLTYAVFVRKKEGRLYFFLAFIIEFLLGLGGYFSSFKEVLIFSLLALAASGLRLTGHQRAALLPFAVIVFFLGVVWSAIKTEYRSFVSAGTGQQVVLVSPAARAGKLAELIGELDGEHLKEGLDKLLRRITYVEFFGVVLNRVPSVIEHTHGDLWFDAIRRPFMPRLFFPEKTSINDSALVNRFTGLGVAGGEQGTSISLGTPAETYIDFGPWLMFLPLFGLGWFGGRLYRFYLQSPRSRGPLGMGLAVTILYPMAFLETSILKLVAALILGVLASFVLLYFIPRFAGWVIPSARLSRL